MKFTIMGFNQKKLIELGLDVTDALILRYFVDFKDSGSMTIEIHKNKPYYWLNYSSLIKEIPIIKIKNKDVLRRRLKKLVECNVLDFFLKKKGGSYSFYSLGLIYPTLICNNNLPTQKKEPPDLKVGTSRLKSRNLPTQKKEPSYLKVGTLPTQKSEQKIHLLKDYSIKDSSIKDKDKIQTLSFPTPFHKKVFNNFEEITYKTWFASCKVVEDKEEIQIITSSKFITDVIVQKYKKALEVLTGKKIIVKE